jgi:glycosyltransferase involved in cell wall biosynthesis
MITFFTPSFADEVDTNAQNLTVKEIVARLPPRQFHVAMFCQGRPDPRIASRPNTTLWKWRAHGNTALSGFRILGRIPDIYFFPRLGPFDDLFFYLRKTLGLHTQIVTYYVSGGLDQEPPNAKLARNLREADVVVGNSCHVSSLLAKNIDRPVPTIYDGVDQRFYFPSDRNSGRSGNLSVLYAGSFRSYKRADLVVREAARWPGVQFRLAGDGEEQNACRALAAQLLCRNVDFLGHLNQAQLGEEMRRADIFFFPSSKEGHPQVLLQAAASGLPCIARNSYRPEFVVHGETGLLANSDQELGQALERLLTDDQLRKSMSVAAPAHVSRFDLDCMAKQWTEVFHKAARISG